MFGSEYKAKSWTLIANYFDYSLVRNYLFYKMASLFDDVKFSSAHQFVELYLNGEYQGVYLFCDQMQTGDGRVDIDESISESGDNGYFLEMNYRVPQEGGRENIEYFVSNHGTIYEIKTPDTEDENYLKNPQKYVDFIKNSVDAAYSSTASNKSWEQITNLIDVNTFADGYIVEELAKNTDVMGLSTFLVKDKGGKIEFGPVWDFDISSGNVNYGPGTQESCPATELWADKVWFSRLLSHNEFKNLVAEKLEKYQPIIDELIDELDVEKEGSLYKKYGEKFEKNFEKWNILGTNVWNQTDEILKLKTNKEQIIFLKNWLTFRNNYLQTIYQK